MLFCFSNFFKPFVLWVHVFSLNELLDVVHADVMVGMGYNLEEIQDSLAKMKYDEITATYLLLGRKASEVQRMSHTAPLLLLSKNIFCPACFVLSCIFPCQLEPSDSASSSNLSLAKPRPNSELNGQSPSHLKVHRSVSSNHKQRRYSEQGEQPAGRSLYRCYSLSTAKLRKLGQVYRCTRDCNLKI